MFYFWKWLYKFILVLCIFTLSSLQIFACDACGGGMLMTSDIYGLSLKNYFGINYNYAKFQNLKSTDKLQQIDFLGRVSCFKNKLILSLRIPFHHKERSFTEGQNAKSIKGLGDIIVLANYNIYQNDEKINKIAIRGQVGGGLKLWNAPYNHYIELEEIPKQFNLGTQSLAVIARTHWFINATTWGVDVQANYSKMFKNSNDFKFGDQLSIQAMFSKPFAIGKTETLRSYIGFLSEIVGKDRYKGNNFDDETGGNVLYGKVVFAYMVNNFAIIPQVNIPIKANYSNEVKGKSRLSLMLNYAF